MNRQRGMTFLEVLVAALLIAIASAAAVASWQITTRAPASKRVTEMGSLLAVREIERLKAITYPYLPDVPANNPTISYYDKNGQFFSSINSVNGGYKVKSWVIVAPGTPTTNTVRDLREIHVVVSDNGETKQYETLQTELSFGGL